MKHIQGLSDQLVGVPRLPFYNELAVLGFSHSNLASTRFLFTCGPTNEHTLARVSSRNLHALEPRLDDGKSHVAYKECRSQWLQHLGLDISALWGLQLFPLRIHKACQEASSPSYRRRARLGDFGFQRGDG